MGSASDYDPTNWSIGGFKPYKPFWKYDWWKDLDPTKKPPMPDMPGAPPPAPEMQDEAIRNAKLAERRRQLGLAGRQSTWLTGARGDTNQPTIGAATLLGGKSALLGD
jgi:hypothetical protein